MILTALVVLYLVVSFAFFCGSKVAGCRSRLEELSIRVVISLVVPVMLLLAVLVSVPLALFDRGCGYSCQGGDLAGEFARSLRTISQLPMWLCAIAVAFASILAGALCSQ